MYRVSLTGANGHVSLFGGGDPYHTTVTTPTNNGVVAFLQNVKHLLSGFVSPVVLGES